MALSQSDLQRLLESPRTADGIELVRDVAERMLQELIEAELSGVRGNRRRRSGQIAPISCGPGLTRSPATASARSGS